MLNQQPTMIFEYLPIQPLLSCSAVTLAFFGCRLPPEDWLEEFLVLSIITTGSKFHTYFDNNNDLKFKL
ncbi:unnamed protein product [Rhizophagus irregularis]|uniref:Uncharacterized protein n=1 Tax=Rhizophagus irregularis TaxID=588596 RepID=A0A916EE03_9GLOM|nr:unnamed protein product [Rhizophagus irregularis]CAB5386792.1 unnamed protein product [Rhizophagus irregularis]